MEEIMRTAFTDYGVLSEREMMLRCIKEVTRIAYCDSRGINHRCDFDTRDWFDMDIYEGWVEYGFHSGQADEPPWRNPVYLEQIAGKFIADSQRLLATMTLDERAYWEHQLEQQPGYGILVLRDCKFQTLKLPPVYDGWIPFWEADEPPDEALD